MATTYTYKFHCSVENLWFEESSNLDLSNYTPHCPNDITHAITVGSTSIVAQVEESIATPSISTDFKGRLRCVDTSRTDPYSWSYFTSRGDHKTLGIGEGEKLIVSMSNETEIVKSIDFIEDVEMHYGITTFKGIDVEDMVSVWIHAPATEMISWVSGPKFMKYPVGTGMNMILPAPDGYPGDVFQFDTSNGKIPIPVESYDATWNPTGFWDRPLNPTVENGYNIDGYLYNPAMQGQFNFYDFPIDLGWFVNNCSFVSENSSSIVLNNEDACRCYKGWKVKLQVDNGYPTRTTPLKLAVVLKLNRKTIR